MKRLTVAALLLLAVIAAACDRQEVVVPPTSTLPQPTAVATTATIAADPASDAVPTTTAAPRAAPEYTIIARVAGDQGDELVVLLDPGDYDDNDIELLMGDIVDEYAPVAAHIIDDAELASIVVEAGDHELLAEHYYAMLEDGNKVTYLGPLAEFGVFFLGS